jgi:hypothetical protein
LTRLLRVPRDIVRLEDHLAEHEPWYRSRGEAQIGRLLDRYEIPFAYEQPLRLYDGVRWRQYVPDFSLPIDRSTSRLPLILEYLGMPDRSDYVDRWERKLEVYRMNDVPLKVIRPYDLSGSDWPVRLAQSIRSAYVAAARPDWTPLPSRVSASYRRTHARCYSGTGS